MRPPVPPPEAIVPARPPEAIVPARPSVAADSAEVALRIAAHGTEPFWAVVVSDSGVVYSSPDEPDGVRFPRAAPVQLGDTLVVRAARGGAEPRRLELRVWPGDCTNGMSEQVFPMTARLWLLWLSDEPQEGCATTERRGS